MKIRLLVISLILGGLFIAAYQSIACEPPPPPPNHTAYAVLKAQTKYVILGNSTVLDGTRSSDADGGGFNNDGIYKFEWDCTNNGSYEHTEAPGDGKYSYTYPQAATYVARIRVTGNKSYDIDTDICCVYVSQDSDSDNMPDKWETDFGLNPNSNDASQDPDSDGSTNLQEYTNATNPLSSDSSDYVTVAKLIARTMRAYQARFCYRGDGSMYVPWPKNNGSSGGPHYPSDGYYQGYCGANHPTNAVYLVSWLVARFWGDYPINDEFVRDDYWDPTLLTDSGGELCSSQWTYCYVKYNRDPEFENIPWVSYNVTSSNYRNALREIYRVINEQYKVVFPKNYPPKNSPYYTNYNRKYGVSWWINGCSAMSCAQARSYPSNTCDTVENETWPSQWEDVPDGTSKTPRVKEWTSDFSGCGTGNGYRAEKEVVRGKITCNLTKDTGSADCYVQLKPQRSDTDNYSNIEPDFDATEYWQDLASRFGDPTTGGVWTASDYFGNFTPDHDAYNCNYGWRDNYGQVSYYCWLDGYNDRRNYYGWELATTVLVGPIFHGDEQVTCGDFDCSTSWITNGGWQINTTSGKAVFSGTQETNGTLEQYVNVEADQYYIVDVNIIKMEYDGDDDADLGIYLGGTIVGGWTATVGDDGGAVGMHRFEHVKATNTDNFKLNTVVFYDVDPGSSLEVEVDSVSIVKEMP